VNNNFDHLTTEEYDFFNETSFYSNDVGDTRESSLIAFVDMIIDVAAEEKLTKQELLTVANSIATFATTGYRK